MLYGSCCQNSVKGQSGFEEPSIGLSILPTGILILHLGLRRLHDAEQTYRARGLM